MEAIEHDVWLDQAVRDLTAAQLLNRDGYTEWAIYLAAQAVEKAFKAYQHAAGFDPPSSPVAGHDLELLGEPMWRAVNRKDNELVQQLIQLNGMAKDARYPQNGKTGVRFGPERSTSALKTAEDVVAFARDTIERLATALRPPTASAGS